MALVIGNWKSYLDHFSGVALAQSLVAHYVPSDSCEVVICPSHSVIGRVHQLIKNGLSLGVQDISPYNHGAHTGDVPAQDMADLGCRYAIIGHSERRADYHENSHIIIKKLLQATKAGLIPVICIGESLDCYRKANTRAFLQSQLDPIFLNKAVSLTTCVIAYEPIWAIGTNYTPKLEEIQDIHAFIAEYMRYLCPGMTHLRLLYGGSVNPKNCQAIGNLDAVNGFLVGRASTRESDFLSIIAQSNREFHDAI